MPPRPKNYVYKATQRPVLGPFFDSLEKKVENAASAPAKASRSVTINPVTFPLPICVSPRSDVVYRGESARPTTLNSRILNSFKLSSVFCSENLLVSPTYARTIWRSLLSFPEVMPLGRQAMTVTFCKLLPWWAELSDADVIRHTAEDLMSWQLLRDGTDFIGARALDRTDAR